MDESDVRAATMRTDGDAFENAESERDDVSDAPQTEDAAVGDDSDMDDDQEEEDDEDSSAGGDDQLEREWAAMEIQHAWRSHSYAQQQQQEEFESGAERSSKDQMTPLPPEPRKNEAVCCSCFGLIETASDSVSNREDDEQVFCAACLYVMSKSTTMPTAANTPGSHSVSSPLPKLSMLAQAEAKYQDQLQLLRAQQELLRQQQQEMQNRKSAQAKQLAAERALARERRRLFQLTMERKRREEELKYQLQQVSKSSISSPEQEEDEEGVDSTDGTMTPQSKPLNRKKKKMKEIIPIPLRRTLLQQVASEMNSPLTHLPGLGLDKKTHHSSCESQEQQQQRKTHFMKKMVGCYAQDLTPLVNDHKPKLLPTSSPSQPSSSSSSLSYGQGSTKKSLQKPHNQQHQQQQPMSRASPHSLTKAKALTANNKKHPHSKKKPSQPVKLHPIAARKPNNQHDELEWEWHKASSSSPLTAEIKPISWIYELGKGVLDEELHSLSSPPSNLFYQLPTDSQALARFAQLDSVQEENDLELQPPSSSFDLRLQHKLPAKTVLSSSSSLSSYTDAPATTVTTGSSNTSNTSSSFASSTPSGQSQQQQPQWEYSTDRLASLLEKYNVSVTSTIANNSTAIK